MCVYGGGGVLYHLVCTDLDAAKHPAVHRTDLDPRGLLIVLRPSSSVLKCGDTGLFVGAESDTTLIIQAEPSYELTVQFLSSFYLPGKYLSEKLATEEKMRR